MQKKKYGSLTLAPTGKHRFYQCLGNKWLWMKLNQAVRSLLASFIRGPIECSLGFATY